MSKIYFFVENRVGKVAALTIFSTIVLLVASGVISFGQFQEIFNLVNGWFN